jgi:hypothetical protein
METVQIQLPSIVAQRIRQEIHSDKAMNDVVVEAIDLWLRQRQIRKSASEHTLASLRRAGLVMTSEKQRALTESMKSRISSRQSPSREEVEHSLADLESPLSAEIDSMLVER